jgi:hypothetical protein
VCAPRYVIDTTHSLLRSILTYIHSFLLVCAPSPGPLGRASVFICCDDYVLLEGNLEAAGHGQAGGINDQETISENTYQRQNSITYHLRVAVAEARSTQQEVQYC